MEGIIGAFVAGLAINYAGQRDVADRQVEAIGQGLFIPAFFFAIGFLVDLPTFATTLVRQPALVTAVVGGLVAAKLAAAALAGGAWGYDRGSMLMMWSLSLPQVAATLATALVAFEARGAGGARLIDEPLLNAVLVLMVATSTLGPILTERVGGRLAASTRPGR